MAGPSDNAWPSVDAFPGEWPPVKVPPTFATITPRRSSVAITPVATEVDIVVFPLGAPTITSVSPNSGHQGTVVTIIGTGFIGTTWVGFGGYAAWVFEVVSDSEISATVRTGYQGPADLEVRAPRGTVHYTGFSLVATAPAPVVTGISPASGPAGSATPVTLTGTGFTGLAGVSENGASSGAPVAVSDTEITGVLMRPGIGTVEPIVIVDAGGILISSSDGPVFTYVPEGLPPTITSLSPSSGSAAGGASIVIAGTHLTSTISVEFGGNLASFHVDSDTQVTATLPAGTAGTVTVTLTAPGGAVTSSFTYNAPVTTELPPLTMRLGTEDDATIISSNASWVNQLSEIISYWPDARDSKHFADWFTGKLGIYLNLNDGPTTVTLQDSDGANLWVPYAWNSTTDTFSRRTADVRSSSYRTGFVGQLKTEFDYGARRVWIDDVNQEVEIAARRANHTSAGAAPLMDMSWWPAAVADFLAYVRTQMRAYALAQVGDANAFKIIHNQRWYAMTPARTTDTNIRAAVQAADWMNVEYGVTDGGLGNGGAAPGSTEPNYNYGFGDLAAHVDAVHALGTGIRWEGMDSSQSAAAQKYIRAAFELLRDPARGDTLSIHGLNPPTAIPAVFAGMNLGAPLGARTQSGAVLTRLFELGRVDLTPHAAGQAITDAMATITIY